MGITRKLLSTSTMGLVDFRSDKERVARSARRTDKGVRAQNRLIAQQNALLAQEQTQQVLQDQRDRRAQQAVGDVWAARLQRDAAPAAPINRPEALPQGAPIPLPVAGWYPRDGALCWWDGQAWTAHTAPMPPQM